VLTVLKLFACAHFRATAPSDSVPALNMKRYLHVNSVLLTGSPPTTGIPACENACV
jgi:hypothetical protein